MNKERKKARDLERRKEDVRHGKLSKEKKIEILFRGDQKDVERRGY